MIKIWSIIVNNAKKLIIRIIINYYKFHFDIKSKLER